MCKQSTQILQGYLTELISTSKVSPDNFINSELRVTLCPLKRNHDSCIVKRHRKVRITKEQRCSLLKKLLMSKTRGPKKTVKKKHVKTAHKGGLRNIINFTRNYNFGYKIDSNHNQNDPTPLSRLTNFTNTFFMNNFADFQNTILYIIENRDNLSESDDDDDMFHTNPEPEITIKCEELIVEPDIKIKTEIDFEDCEPYSCNYYVETSYSDTECKKENMEMYPVKEEPVDYYEQEPQNSVQMLDRLVGDLGSGSLNKTFSRHSVRCRTRGNPYINPKLKQQFQLKSFQCEKCCRYFKSPGYLKAHMSKVHSK